MNSDALLDPVPIRFSPAVSRRVKKAASRFGLNSSEIIRRAVDAQLPKWEQSGVLIIEGKKEAA